MFAQPYRHFVDHSRRAVQNLISLAQPPCHFVSVSSLSLWRGANLDIARNLLVTSCALDSSRGVVLSF